MICPHCKTEFIPKKRGAANRAERIGAPLYCGRVCAGLARRNPNKLTGDAAKQAKREYDRARLEKKGEEIRQKKREFFYANRERILAEQVIYRAKHMDRHVEYCRQPEYKAWKAKYDEAYRAKKVFGEFSEGFLILQEIEKEIASRASRYEIYASNGLLNKSIKRKRAL